MVSWMEDAHPSVALMVPWGLQVKRLCLERAQVAACIMWACRVGRQNGTPRPLCFNPGSPEEGVVE